MLEKNQSTKEDEWKLNLDEPIANKNNHFYYKAINVNDCICACLTEILCCRSFKGNNRV